MTQHNKQKAVTNQVNQIRNAVKLLQQMTKNGFYLDQKQRKALACICDIELAPLSI